MNLPIHLKTALEMALLIKDGRSISEHGQYSEFMEATHNGGSLARLIQLRETVEKDAREFSEELKNDILEQLNKTIK